MALPAPPIGGYSPTNLSDCGGGWMSFAGFVGGMTNSIFSIHPPKRRWKPRYWHSFESSNELVWACEHPKFWPGSSARVSFAQAKAGPQNGISMAHLHLPQQTQQNFQKKTWRNCETMVGFESFSRLKTQVSFIPRNDYGYIKKKYQYIIPSP